MKILLKKMPKSVSEKRRNNFMADMGTTAFCHNPCKQKDESAEEESQETGDKETPLHKYRQAKINEKSIGSSAGF